GIRAWESEWFELPTRAGDLLAGILNAAPGSVSMHENVAIAQAVALSTLDFQAPRNRLVCTAEDFPSELYLYEGLARRGAEIVRVPAREGRRIEWADVAAVIDERTAVVAVSHVMFRTAQILEVAKIFERARAAGAVTLLDAYQSVGTVPVDVREMGVDFLTGGSVKWLCGGPGAGYLYARPEHAARAPSALTGWLAHEHPFAFDSGAMRPHAGARRYWTGTPGIPSYAAARCGYEIIAAVGVPAIREKSLRQTGRMIELADEYGLTLVSPRPADDRGGTVGLDVPHADTVCAALLADDILLDFRPGVGLRLAPHFYTADEEVERVMKRVRDQVRRRG
ncbi:MAG: aminotransferase class V-fold PLP-dependent enzyme, partial [Gaiellaceae bacterium]